MNTSFKIVSPDIIPKGGDCPLDDLAELYKLGLAMQIVCDKEKGIGLSAVQVGIPYNFFIINQDNNYRFFLNCEYIPINQDKEKYIEGCLSIRDSAGKLRYFEVERFKNIIVKGKELVSDPELQVKDYEVSPSDYYKIVYQHEIDHNFGIMIDQIGKEVFLWSKN